MLGFKNSSASNLKQHYSKWVHPFIKSIEKVCFFFFAQTIIIKFRLKMMMKTIMIVLLIHQLVLKLKLKN